MPCRILYFRGGILEESEDFAPEDLFEAARLASSRHPDPTAEIWQDGRKTAVIRPCSRNRPSHPLPPHIRRVLDGKLDVSASTRIERSEKVDQDKKRSGEQSMVLQKPDLRH